MAFGAFLGLGALPVLSVQPVEQIEPVVLALRRFRKSEGMK
jgi:hypothetical protein